MNLLGKILTVIIMLVSVLTMYFAVQVYATHKNWKKHSSQLQTQLNNERNKNSQLTNERDRLDNQLKSEETFRIQEVSKLVSEREQLIAQNSTLQQDLDQLRQQSRSNTAALASTQANNEKLAAEVQTLRDDIKENQQARDEAVASAVQVTDELHQAQGKLTLVTERNAQLAQRLGNSTSLLRENGIDPNTEPDAIIPMIRGVVSAMHRTAGTQLIEITIGADDGLKKGHTVEVYRGERYLGRAEIMRTEPDRAVGRILRRFQQGQIQENDNVATRLRVG